MMIISMIFLVSCAHFPRNRATKKLPFQKIELFHINRVTVTVNC